MQKESIRLEETDCFSRFFIDYITENEKLTPFYRLFPNLSNFQENIEKRVFSEDKRYVLSQTLEDQYSHLETHKAVLENIKLLKRNKTFTIVTGHQLNIFTGPLYFIYKIITVINACKELKKAYPDYDFVPVYWMASEDHDLEEIRYFYYEGKKIEWETDQTGAVGRFKTETLNEIAKSLPDRASFFEKAYNEESLADAVRNYVNHLFEKDGLVVIDGDNNRLKQNLKHVIEADLFDHTPEKIVSETSNRLESLGYKPQVYPRQINLFYLNGDIRERLIRSNKGFEVIDKELHFSGDEIKQLIKSNPEQFSPNVILRPLYQELILPNLAYVGGPSELIYWLQFKDLFEHFKVPFPILLPRNFALVNNRRNQELWEKIGLSTKDLFLSSDHAFSKWIANHSGNPINYSKEVEALEKLEETMKAKASQVDSTLVQHIEALHAGFKQKIHKAEKKILRAEKRKHDDTGRQIEKIKEFLFPGGSLQERKENFLSFYVQDPLFIQKLKDEFDPFVFEMNLLFE